MDSNIKWPRHKASLSVEHQPHKAYYESIAQHMESLGGAAPSWATEDSERLALEKDELWFLLWYPDTPVAFFSVAGHSLEDALEGARMIQEQEDSR